MIEALRNPGNAQLVADQVDRMTDEIVALAQALIRFDSVNQPPWGNEGPCQAFVAECLRDLGCTVERFRPDEVQGIEDDPAYLRGRDYTGRPNVVGTLAGAGGGRSLHLAAHADVVPVGDLTQWTVEPFGALIKGGKIYGRGAVDDRDGLTGMLAAVRVIQRAGFRLRGDLILSSYVDEEFAGGNGLLAIVRKGYRGEAAINCDGVGFVMGVANTGGGPFRVLIQSQAEAAQPTPGMRRVLAACWEYLASLSHRWQTYWHHPLYPPGTPWIFKRSPIELKDWTEGLTQWSWLSHGPACGLSGYATTLPGQDHDRSKAEVAEAVARAYASAQAPDVYPPRVEWVYRFMDACEVPPTAPIVRALSQSFTLVTGRPAEVTGGPRSDLYVLALHGGVPTVNFGVGNVLRGPGSAHEPDECIDIQRELIPYVKTLVLTILDWCGYTHMPL
jgi:acetylornithine deacetylase